MFLRKWPGTAVLDLEFAAESKSAFSVGWKLLRACINCDYGFTGLVAICSCRILREKFLAFNVTQLAQDFFPMWLLVTRSFIRFSAPAVYGCFHFVTNFFTPPPARPHV